MARFIDIGVNLTDRIFRGVYHGKVAHGDDLSLVLSRASFAGVASQILTGGNLNESLEALKMASEHGLYSTAGCHPTRTVEMEMDPNLYLSQLRHLIRSSPRIVAIGECGLDYDRLNFAPAEVQKRHFAAQLDLAVEERKPLFLHSRNAHNDLVHILSPRIQEIHHALGGEYKHGAKKVGVVHSFTGTMQEMNELVQLGLFIGINGCSLKTQENLEVVKAVPLERIMLETDAPWCDPRSTHASHPFIQAFKEKNPAEMKRYMPKSVRKEKWAEDCMVKGRNEPCVIGLVAAAVAGIKGIPLQELADAALSNTEWLFDMSN